MHKQRSRSRRNIALLVAVSAALYGLDAQADERSEEEPGHEEFVKERTVADIVNEARARVEADRRPYSDWQGYKKEQPKKKLEEPKPRSWYVGFGVDNDVSYSDRELYRLRSEVMRNYPLQYLETPYNPHDDKAFENYDPGGMSLFVGRELTDWLDVELAMHGVSSFYQLHSTLPVARTTMTPDNPRKTDATQFTSFYEKTYSLTAIPRWNINRYVALYARLGLGYSQGNTDSSLAISAIVPGEPDCRKDAAGVETCRPTSREETINLHTENYRDEKFFPVVGAGVRLLGGIRLEYIYRANVPIGETTTDISATFFSLCWRSEWR